MEEGNTLDQEIKNDNRLFPYFECMNDSSLCTKYRISLPIAAFTRYGAIDVGELNGVGKLRVAYDVERANNNGEITTKREEITLNVVGYVETEADKLLSTGVSMDPESEEYQIVMEQLQNPVIYSLCGDFLK